MQKESVVAYFWALFRHVWRKYENYDKPQTSQSVSLAHFKPSNFEYKSQMLPLNAICALFSKRTPRPCHSSGDYSPASHSGGSGSSPGHVGFVVDKVALGGTR
jgi:hypothetical protein